MRGVCGGCIKQGVGGGISWAHERKCNRDQRVGCRLELARTCGGPDLMGVSWAGAGVSVG